MRRTRRTLWSRSERRSLAETAVQLRDANASWGTGLNAFGDYIAGRYGVRKDGEGWDKMYTQAVNLYDKATRKAPPLAPAVESGELAVALAPQKTSQAPSLPGGIGGRPYTEWDLRRDVSNRLMAEPTEIDKLHNQVTTLERFEADLDLREQAGENVRFGRGVAARRRQSLSAIYGIDLTGTESESSR